MTKKEIAVRQTVAELKGMGADKNFARYMAEINDITGFPEEVLFWSLLGF